MASSSTNTTVHYDLIGALRAALRDMVARWTAYRTYRKTSDELSTLSERELHDLGLNRAMIEQVSRQAAGYLN